MKNSTTVIYLIIAGLLLLAIGGAILFAPHAFHSGSGVALGDNANLLSEIRAPGGLLAGSGVIILLGACRRQLRSQAVQLSILVYASFGLARLVSLALDGMPSSSIVGAMLLELLIALFGLVILWRARGSNAESRSFGVAPVAN